MNLDITPQQALEAETAVLGSVLLKQNVMDEIGELLEPVDFSSVAHETIWKCMKFLYSKNSPIDFVTVTNMLNAANALEKVGSVTYLAALAESVPSTANVAHYAKIVRSRGYRKRAYEAGQKIMELAVSDDGLLDEDFFQNIERSILAVRPASSGDMKHVSETRKEYFEYLAQKDDFIYSGFKAFDEWMGG